MFSSTDRCHHGQQPALLCDPRPGSPLPLLQRTGRKPDDDLGTTSTHPHARAISHPRRQRRSRLKTCSSSRGKCLSNVPTFRHSQLVRFHTFVLQKEFYICLGFTSPGSTSAVAPTAALLPSPVYRCPRPRPTRGRGAFLSAPFILPERWLCFLQKHQSGAFIKGNWCPKDHSIPVAPWCNANPSSSIGWF